MTHKPGQNVNMRYRSYATAFDNFSILKRRSKPRRCVMTTKQYRLFAGISGPVHSTNVKVLVNEDNYADKNIGVCDRCRQRQRGIQSVRPMSKPTDQQKACDKMCVLCGVYDQGHFKGAKRSEWNKARSSKLLRVLNSKGATDADTSDRLSS